MSTCGRGDDHERADVEALKPAEHSAQQERIAIIEAQIQRLTEVCGAAGRALAGHDIGRKPPTGYAYVQVGQTDTACKSSRDMVPAWSAQADMRGVMMVRRKTLC